MVIGIGFIKLIFTVNLWRICSNKLIENESFIRTSHLNDFNSNVGAIEPLSLNESSNLINQTYNLTEKNVDLHTKVRMHRRLDSIENNRFFYGKSKEHQRKVKGRTNSSSRYYINYQQAYGIRFDPNKIKRSFSFKDKEVDELLPNDELIEEITTAPSDLNSDRPNQQEDSDYDAEGQFLNPAFVPPVYPIINETNDFLSSTPSSYYSDLQTYSPSNNTSNQLSNIMKPSKIQTALQHFNTRIKNLFSLGVSPNRNSQRFLNVFNVINFENVPCASSNPPLTQLNGTCYHRFECDQLGGVAVDSCAGGFGVCCVFQFECGGSTNQTVSYFKSPNFPEAARTRLICTFAVDLWPNVNQVFLEFLFFELRPPLDGSCVDDQFVVAGQSSNNVIPILCGINSGQHMYVDVESALDRKIYLSVLAASADARAFNIRISQVLNGFGQAPQNCLQYYQDAIGIVQTFNYDDAAEIVETRIPTYFNNLNYAICIKRLPEYCTIQYTNSDAELDFQLVNVDQDGTSVIPSGQAGAEIYNCADDYISINGIRLCGEKLNDASVTEDFSVNAPVTDYSAGPIILPIRTNDAVVGRGFKLIYNQLPCQDNST